MSASEMERLRAALREFGEHKVECGLWDCFYPDEITNGPIHDECTCGLSAALSGSSAPQVAATPDALRVALERIASCNGADPEWDEDCEQDTPAAIARAALSMKSERPEDAEGGSQKGSGR